MAGWSDIVITFYVIAMAFLALFGVHRYSLLYLYLRNRIPHPELPPQVDGLPKVTVQLPIYNERYVIDRLLDSVVAIDYPRSLFEVQVLDDSTDDTSDMVAVKVESLRAAGHDIVQIRRSDRTGFKAGALQNGLEKAKGELVAVFDADFTPDPLFLRRVVPHFQDESVGMVQTRWDHLNRDYSLLTRIQSILLDGHFVVEHIARSRTGRFFNFNGTAGIWRKSCIESAGGWHFDTLTEDLDLSYRAQLKKWHFVYLDGVTSPAELPVEMNAFKSQQHRWAKGSIQTALKLLPEIWRSAVPLKVKVEATAHLSSNLAYAVMIIPVFLIFPVLILQASNEIYRAVFFYSVVFFASTLSVTLFYLAAEKRATGSARAALKYLPGLMSLGIGMTLNNARAVFEALARKSTPFLRTPKYNVVGRKDLWKKKIYKARWSTLSLIEMVLAVYFFVSVFYALTAGLYLAVPILLLFLFGFLYVGVLSMLHRA